MTERRKQNSGFRIAKIVLSCNHCKFPESCDKMQTHVIPESCPLPKTISMDNGRIIVANERSDDTLS